MRNSDALQTFGLDKGLETNAIKQVTIEEAETLNLESTTSGFTKTMRHILSLTEDDTIVQSAKLEERKLFTDKLHPLISKVMFRRMDGKHTEDESYPDVPELSIYEVDEAINEAGNEDLLILGRFFDKKGNVKLAYRCFERAGIAPEIENPIQEGYDYDDDIPKWG